MKKVNLKGKLSLGKEVVTKLTSLEMKKVLGGDIVTNGCQTEGLIRGCRASALSYCC